MNKIDSSIVEKVWNDLDGQVSREQISQIVAAITLKYQNAAVKAFVPIFIHREALEQLKEQLNENHLSANGRIPFANKPRQAPELAR